MYLENTIKSGAPVRNREFAYALNVARHDGAEVLETLNEQRIETSSKKISVSPKTLGQKKYVEMIAANDVILGVGPAGTGKTYSRWQWRWPR